MLSSTSLVNIPILFLRFVCLYCLCSLAMITSPRLLLRYVLILLSQIGSEEYIYWSPFPLRFLVIVSSITINFTILDPSISRLELQSHVHITVHVYSILKGILYALNTYLINE